MTYTLAAQDQGGKLHVSRSVTVNFIFLDPKYYSALRRYFQQIKTTDDQQVVVDPGPVKAEN